MPRATYQRQRETNLTRADTWGASINFDWPLFEGGRTDAQVAKAKAEQQRLKDLRHDLTAAIRNEVLADQRLVEQKQLLVDAYRVNLQAEERIYRDMLDRQGRGRNHGGRPGGTKGRAAHGPGQLPGKYQPTAHRGRSPGSDPGGPRR